MAFNDLTKAQQRINGNPGEKYPNWIASITPDNEKAGYLLATSLIHRMGNEPSGMIVLNGNMKTPAAVLRNMGLKRALFPHSAIQIYQEFSADWRADIAEKIIFRALKRYPKTAAIWCANDPMALGAIKAIQKNGKVPGQDIMVSGLNWSAQAIDAIASGTMVASVGGHFMVGGWTLVLIYDYIHGGFSMEEGKIDVTRSVFSLIDRENVDTFGSFISNQAWERINFKQFSKVHHPKMGSYDFSLKKIGRFFLK